MKKRLVSLFLALAMTWGLLPAQAVLLPRHQQQPRHQPLTRQHQPMRLRPRGRQRVPRRITQVRMPRPAIR